MKSKNFQRAYSRAYDHLLWGFEKNYNLGDFALLFVNPDFRSDIDATTDGNFVTSEEASKHFDLITETSFDYTLKKKFIKNLRSAFLEVFQELQDYEAPKKVFKLNEHELNPQTTQINFQTAERLDTTPELNNANQGNVDPLADQNKKDNIQIDGTHLNIQQTNINVQNSKGELNQDTKNPKPSMSNLSGKPNQSETKPKKAAKPQKKTDKELKEEEKRKGDIRKIMVGGKFLRDQCLEKRARANARLVPQFSEFVPNKPPESADNFMKSANTSFQPIKTFDNLDEAANANPNPMKSAVLDPSGVDRSAMKYVKEMAWTKTSNTVRDYLTLLRQLIYVIFAYNGVIIREFVSSNGHLIIAVCYGHPTNIRKIAENMGLGKPVDISLVDLMSLEPVDTKYRPLRANKVLWNNKEWQKAYFKKISESQRSNLATASQANNIEQQKLILTESDKKTDQPNESKDGPSLPKPGNRVLKSTAPEDANTKNKIVTEDINTDNLSDYQIQAIKFPGDLLAQQNNTSMNFSLFKDPKQNIVDKSILNEISFNQSKGDVVDMSLNKEAPDKSSPKQVLEPMTTTELQDNIIKLINYIDFKGIIRSIGGTWEKNDVNNESDNKRVRERSL
jgi:hypothetical protein